MKYRVVESYYRRDHFDLYRSYPNPFYAATLEVEVSGLKEKSRSQGCSFFALLSYRFLKAAQSIEDLRYRFRDGEIVLYERLHAGMTVPAPGGRFSFAYATYQENEAKYLATTEADMKEAGQQVTLRQSDHDNYIYFTALPKVPFTGLTHAPLPKATDGPAMVAFGRYRWEGERLLIPTSIQVNHCFIDGRALGDWVERIEAQCSSDC